jgi:hypothetical protein
VTIPVGSIGTVVRIDADGDIYVNFGAELNPLKMIRTSMFDQIEAVADSVCARFWSHLFLCDFLAIDITQSFTFPLSFCIFSCLFALNLKICPFSAPPHQASDSSVAATASDSSTSTTSSAPAFAPAFTFPGAATAPAAASANNASGVASNPAAAAPTLSTAATHFRLNAATVPAGGLRVRRGPSTDTEHIGTLADFNAVYAFSEVNGDWAKLEHVHCGFALMGSDQYRPHNPQIDGWCAVRLDGEELLVPCAAPTVATVGANAAPATVPASFSFGSPASAPVPSAAASSPAPSFNSGNAPVAAAPTPAAASGFSFGAGVSPVSLGASATSTSTVASASVAPPQFAVAMRVRALVEIAPGLVASFDSLLLFFCHNFSLSPSWQMKSRGFHTSSYRSSR